MSTQGCAVQGPLTSGPCAFLFPTSLCSCGCLAGRGSFQSTGVSGYKVPGKLEMTSPGVKTTTHMPSPKLAVLHVYGAGVEQEWSVGHAPGVGAG